MAKLGFVDAFSKFGAMPLNHMWAVSAIADDGSIVVSCWAHYFRKGPSGTLHYVDSLSRWSGNERGSSLLKTHLELAGSEGRDFRMVVATAKQPELVEANSDAGEIEKTFHVRQDVIGRLLSFDGNGFVIEFRKT